MSVSTLYLAVYFNIWSSYLVLNCLVKLIMGMGSANRDNTPSWTDCWNQWQRSSNLVPFTATQIPSRQQTVQNLRSHPLQARVGPTFTKLKEKGNGLDKTSYMQNLIWMDYLSQEMNFQNHKLDSMCLKSSPLQGCFSKLIIHNSSKHSRQ